MHKNSGFTLIEVSVGLAVIAILAAVYTFNLITGAWQLDSAVAFASETAKITRD
ncbi:MAG: type II secretion system protein [Desulfobacterales bacterium]|nr:MAG: type II secretion system protein [Desulfobacterales bacterium]